MELAKLILNVSKVVFALTPFRQYGGSFFYYFLLLAIEDPLANILIKTIKLPQLIIHLLFSYLLILFILKPKQFLKYLLYSIPLIIAYFYLISFFDFSDPGVKSYVKIIIGIAHIIIIAALIRKLINRIKANFEVSLFLCILIFYESITVFKFIVYGLGLSNGMLLFFMATGFEILIGIFFIFFRDDNPKLLIKLDHSRGQ